MSKNKPSHPWSKPICWRLNRKHKYGNPDNKRICKKCNAEKPLTDSHFRYQKAHNCFYRTCITCEKTV